MTGEIVAIAAGAGAVIGWFGKHFQASRGHGSADRVVTGMRAELKEFRQQLATDVKNAVTVALLESELRRLQQ